MKNQLGTARVGFLNLGVRIRACAGRSGVRTGSETLSVVSNYRMGLICYHSVVIWNPAVIQYDVGSGGGGGPPEGQWPEDPEELIEWFVRLANSKSQPPSIDGSQAINEAMASGVGQDRVSATEKGSLFFFSKVEIRWDRDCELIQDTFLSLTNDYPKDVRVQMYFINGDAPITATPDDP